jgi:hypothetical protein
LQTLVATAGAPSCVVGFLTNTAKSATRYIHGLAVVPDARRRGVGRMLLQACVAGARTMGLRSVVLHVGVANRPAVSLYDAEGFEVRRVLRGFFGYDAFGSDNHPVLEYFGGVKDVLAPALSERGRRKAGMTGALPDRYVVLVHEPPPTGSLDERVASLHDAVVHLMQGNKLPHAQVAPRPDAVHLVGHSTGGVDARLLANPMYRWAGGPHRPSRPCHCRGRPRCSNALDPVGSGRTAHVRAVDRRAAFAASFQSRRASRRGPLSRRAVRGSAAARVARR